ncbi:hypothetical protein PIB30_035767 [Stylosanthes scabra]|uniref:Uncharacterized protein n=1 Tax=Stylosanthes scabra TaxID=79078 RepID=A0ABU6SE22_9FABA|nr:hypothetical protein [Stylosanthes scabra]
MDAADHAIHRDLIFKIHEILGRDWKTAAVARAFPPSPLSLDPCSTYSHWKRTHSLLPAPVTSDLFYLRRRCPPPLRYSAAVQDSERKVPQTQRPTEEESTEGRVQREKHPTGLNPTPAKVT